MTNVLDWLKTAKPGDKFPYSGDLRDLGGKRVNNGLKAAIAEGQFSCALEDGKWFLIKRSPEYREKLARSNAQWHASADYAEHVAMHRK